MVDINPLPVISFANIFPHSVGCLFILSTVSFIFLLIMQQSLSVARILLIAISTLETPVTQRAHAEGQ